MFLQLYLPTYFMLSRRKKRTTIADTAVTTQITDYTKKYQQEEISDAENRHHSVPLATADDGYPCCCRWLELIGLYFIWNTYSKCCQEERFLLLPKVFHSNKCGKETHLSWINEGFIGARWVICGSVASVRGIIDCNCCRGREGCGSVGVTNEACLLKRCLKRKSV